MADRHHDGGPDHSAGLPPVGDPPQPAPAAATYTQSRMSELAGDARPTVLVVEDDPAHQVLLEAQLADPRWQVVVVGDLDRARAVLRAREVNIVVLDRFLGGEDAIGLIEQLRSRRRTQLVPVIILSGTTDLESRLSGLDAGALDYVDKSAPAAEVRARVAAHVARSVLARTARARERRERDELIDASVTLARSDSSTAYLRALTNRAAAIAGLDLGVVLTTPGPGRPAQLSMASLTRPDGDDAPMLRAVAAVADPIVAAATGTVGGVVLPPALVPEGTSWAWADTLGGGADDVLLIAGRTPPADPEATARRVADLSALAADGLATRRQREAVLARGDRLLHQALHGQGITSVFHRIVPTDGRPTVGYEALARFSDATNPERRFRAAAALGRGVDLELAAMAVHIQEATALPGDRWLALNASPSALMDDRLGAVLADAVRPIVLELTEHDPVEDYDVLRRRLRRLPGAPRLSVDDAGSGYACMSHVLSLMPAFVKLDRLWIKGIAEDGARQALVGGLRGFAAEIGADLIAEGVEDAADLEAVTALGVPLVQGFHSGPPSAAGALTALTL